MRSKTLGEQTLARFRVAYGREPTVVAYAPGRVEVLGNHTDYNEGFVLSAAINYGTYFAASPASDTGCRLLAPDLGQSCVFPVGQPAPAADSVWANYVKGVLAGLQKHGSTRAGFLGVLAGDVPLGAGLSSSAALEMSAGLALGRLYGIVVDPHTLARIGQAAEHHYVGVKCGLLDQITSLYGRANHLVMTDFRNLDVEAVPLGADACFLMCNTKVKHALVDGEYNERRHKCEEAAAYFKQVLPRPIASLRDVTWEEWQAHAPRMDDHAARRAAHVIGECTRVVSGRALLREGKLAEFGQLMFESHESSRKYFENSCAELDILVDAARKLPGVLGARLSGGGFGGSVVVLVHPRDAEIVGKVLTQSYAKATGQPCDVAVLEPSEGATLVQG